MTMTRDIFSRLLGNTLGRALGGISWEERPDEGEQDEPGQSAITVAEVKVIDQRDQAAKARYPISDARWSGKLKRDYRPPVNLAKRSVGIVLHSMGVTRPESSPRWPLVSSHWVASHEAARWLHPHDRYLIAANMLDVAPLHGVSVESIGKGGSAPVSDAVISTTRECVLQIIAEQADNGAPVEWIAPHRVGALKTSRPNCPGPVIWQQVGEWAAREFDLAVPPDGPLWRNCGVIPASWHGEYWRGGEGLRRMSAHGV